MSLIDFLAVLNYSPTYAANCVLYHPKSRPAKLAQQLGYQPDEEECTKLRYLVAGKHDIKALFPGIVKAA